MDKRGTSFRKTQVLHEQRWYQKKTYIFATRYSSLFLSK